LALTAGSLKVWRSTTSSLSAVAGWGCRWVTTSTAKGDCLILVAGGTWRHIWNFLRLSSPASYGSLPDWLMPLPAYEGYPTRDEVLDLTDSTMPNNHQISVMAAYRRKPPVTTIKAYIAVTTRK